MAWWVSSEQGGQHNLHRSLARTDVGASWFRLWARTAVLGLLLLLLLFGGYELIERQWLRDAPSWMLYRLHLARGIGSALCLGTWAFVSIRQARREYDALLQANLIALEAAVESRVAQQQNLEAQLRHQEKMAGLGLMAAGFAHDLGNPLASIASELELLEGEDDLARFRASLAVLQRHIERINRTLREMTDFARRRRDEVTDVNVDVAIRDSLRLVRHDPRWKQVQVDLQLSPGTPPVRMVEDHLVLVLINLMLNAADAMPSGGGLKIHTEKIRQGTRIKVVDSGTGMSPEVLRNATKPLFSTKGANRGTGLGLSVSDEVVRSVGGTLELLSQPGQGTEVQIWLPGPHSLPEASCPSVS